MSVISDITIKVPQKGHARVSANPGVDVERLLKTNPFNWLIGGTDAHAKNYSFLIDAGDDARLAPPL